MKFTLARIAEVEQMAIYAYSGDGKWKQPHVGSSSVMQGDEIVVWDESGLTREQAKHIAYWDPHRVLAKCKADRLIVDFYKQSAVIREGKMVVHNGWTICALHAVSSQWDDHPDWQPEWAV